MLVALGFLLSTTVSLSYGFGYPQPPPRPQPPPVPQYRPQPVAVHPWSNIINSILTKIAISKSSYQKPTPRPQLSLQQLQQRPQQPPTKRPQIILQPIPQQQPNPQYSHDCNELGNTDFLHHLPPITSPKGQESPLQVHQHQRPNFQLPRRPPSHYYLDESHLQHQQHQQHQHYEIPSQLFEVPVQPQQHYEIPTHQQVPQEQVISHLPPISVSLDDGHRELQVHQHQQQPQKQSKKHKQVEHHRQVQVPSQHQQLQTQLFVDNSYLQEVSAPQEVQGGWDWAFERVDRSKSS